MPRMNGPPRGMCEARSTVPPSPLKRDRAAPRDQNTICPSALPALEWGMAEARQKITFAEMRADGVRGLLVYCSDYRCSSFHGAQRRPMGR